MRTRICTGTLRMPAFPSDLSRVKKEKGSRARTINRRHVVGHRKQVLKSNESIPIGTETLEEALKAVSSFFGPIHQIQLWLQLPPRVFIRMEAFTRARFVIEIFKLRVLVSVFFQQTDQLSSFIRNRSRCSLAPSAASKPPPGNLHMRLQLFIHV